MNDRCVKKGIIERSNKIIHDIIILLCLPEFYLTWVEFVNVLRIKLEDLSEIDHNINAIDEVNSI